MTLTAELTAPPTQYERARNARFLRLCREILTTIIHRGELSFADTRTLWGLNDTSWPQVRDWLEAQPTIETQGKRADRFVARYVGRIPDAAADSHRFRFNESWEAAGSARLVELLRYAQLEKLLGTLLYTVRRSRQAMTGQDRRGTKQELAAALIIQHGRDLFRDIDIRNAIARACRIKAPGRWYPGKGAAHDFTEAAGFPVAFAGIPAPETPADFEYLEGRTDLSPLRDFQIEVQHQMLAVIKKPGGRAIVTLPTGAGKTRVAVDTIRDWLSDWYREHPGEGRVVLWLAHTEELCEQAFACFKQVWQGSNDVCPLGLFRFWGRYTRNLTDHRGDLATMHQRCTVLISTPHRLVRLLEDEDPKAQALMGDLYKLTRLLLVDEAHRAAARMYQHIIDGFIRDTATDTSLIGLTATPFRGEYQPHDPLAGTTELRRIFKRIIEPVDTLGIDPRTALQERRFLARPEWESIETKTLLRPPPLDPAHVLNVDDIEKIDYALKIRADNNPRRLEVLRYLLPVCEQPDTRVIYFGPTVLDAECMAFLLRQQGIASAYVSGNTREVTRRQVIEDFHAGAIKVLCNCEVLTTGFDAPKVTHVIMARPTVSQVLYEQMVGRGLRGPLFGGTETCVIVDCEDNYRAIEPELGYRRFREVWKPKRHRATVLGA